MSNKTVEKISKLKTRTHLSALRAQAVKGEPKLSHQEVLEGFRALRKLIKPSEMTLKQMIKEGRRT